MHLIEKDWNAPGGVRDMLVEYPDEPIAEFVDWLRQSSAWRENNEILERRVLKLNRDLMDWRQRGDTVTIQPLSGGIDWRAKYEALAADHQALLAKQEATQQKRLAGLEAARIARAEKAQKRAERAKRTAVPQ